MYIHVILSSSTINPLFCSLIVFYFSVLSDCQSCTGHNHVINSPAHPYLRQLDQCAWCVQLGSCVKQSDTATCQQMPASGVSWWSGGSQTTHMTSVAQCATEENIKAGFRYSLYEDPIDYNLPDVVSISLTECRAIHMLLLRGFSFNFLFRSLK